MNEPELSFFNRLGLAIRIFFRAIADAPFAAQLKRLAAGCRPVHTDERAASAPPVFAKAPPDAALQLLGLLQQEGRLIDFLEEDVSSYPDAEVGAAVRVVHEGCRRVMRELFTIAPVRSEPEGSRITVPAGFDPSTVRLTGNVVGKAPFTGSLVHRGWKVTSVKLPQVAAGHDTKVLAAAEVEL